MSTTASAKSRHMGQRKRDLRDKLWPGSEKEVWNRHESKGFTTIPRILSLILHLITITHGKRSGNPSMVYLDLWCRVFDDGVVEVTDEEDFAYAAGYSTSRGVRTWRSHVRLLIELGFVRGLKKGSREFGYLLIVDPYLVAEKLHNEDRVPEQWWNAFLALVHKTRAVLPSEKKREEEAKEAETETEKKPGRKKRERKTAAISE